MRVHSRESFVGFLLVLGLATVGCQPVHPASESSATAIGESVAITASATITASVVDTSAISAVVSDTTALTESVGVTESVTSTATGEIVPAADPALIAAGLAVYHAQYCGVCHTLDAADTHGTFGPPHNGLGITAVTRLTDPNYQGSATTPAEYIHESIVDPQVYSVPGYLTTSHRMPSYSFLDAASLDALVAFLLAQ
jgi:mono/diheme cytochrome c family protein